MNQPITKHQSIFNDPIYGFITVSSELIFDIIEHPYFQRLRRINQLGLTNLVYSGANHTRFQHSIGAMFLMQEALNVLTQKGHHITDEEREAALIAILLHDIGHGPFSHTLEGKLIPGISHEDITLYFLEELNRKKHGKLTLVKQLFTKQYPKKFLSQLISSQLDVDRLDYLRRDSFYTGVSEGIVNSQRIIKMMNIHDGELVIENKGIYSIEEFILSRRLMYWQVYMHKTVLSAEFLLTKIIQRVKALNTPNLFALLPDYFTQTLKLHQKPQSDSALTQTLKHFALMDDYDIISAIKLWSRCDDYILSNLCKSLINRNLYKIELQNTPFDRHYIQTLEEKIQHDFKASKEDLKYLIFDGEVNNYAYNPQSSDIKIQYKNNEVKDIMEASEHFNTIGITKIVNKYYLCYPKQAF